jgi:hypothetical protein
MFWRMRFPGKINDPFHFILPPDSEKKSFNADYRKNRRKVAGHKKNSWEWCIFEWYLLWFSQIMRA